MQANEEERNALKEIKLAFLRLKDSYETIRDYL